jgi:hypothetical protein
MAKEIWSAGGAYDSYVGRWSRRVAEAFVPRRAVAEFVRVAAPGGAAAAYVRDYAERMAMMRYFWDADVPTAFVDFDDYWRPFLGGQGPAPGYVASLTEERRLALRDLLRGRLPTGPDGSIPLSARAWAVRGSVRGSSGPVRNG